MDVRRRLTISVLVALLGAAVVAAPVAEAHRLSASKAKRAMKRFTRDVAREVDGSVTSNGDLLLVDSYSVGNRSLAGNGCIRESRHKIWCVNAIEGVGASAGGTAFDWFCVDGVVAWFRNHRSRRVRVRDDRAEPECETFPLAASGKKHRRGTPQELQAIERQLERATP